MNKTALLNEFNTYADVLYHIRKRLIDEHIDIDRYMGIDCHRYMLRPINRYEQFINTRWSIFPFNHFYWGDKFNGMRTIYKGVDRYVGYNRLKFGDLVWVSWFMPVDKNGQWITPEHIRSTFDVYDITHGVKTLLSQQQAVDINVVLHRSLCDGKPAKMAMKGYVPFDDLIFSEPT